MKNIKIATAQFEMASGDKAYNLSVIRELSARAAAAGADAVAFHECSVSGYSFARRLDREQLLELAEPIPDGSSVRALTAIARENGIVVLAGLFEKEGDRGEWDVKGKGKDGGNWREAEGKDEDRNERDGEGRKKDGNGKREDSEEKIYKAYVAVGPEGLIAKFRKLHPFINPNLTPGNEYVIFDLQGWKCGILICYDNNIVENVRATALLGADIIFMPHVTMCTPSTRPGAGFVDPRLWVNRETDPTSLRIEFDGLKGRAWLMKWLPARAYDNAVYAVFSNAIGMDDDQLKNGCSMILDPFGDIIAECRALGNDLAVAVLDPAKLRLAGGYRYRMARRPELYKDIIGQTHTPEQKVVWLTDPNSGRARSNPITAQ